MRVITKVEEAFDAGLWNAADPVRRRRGVQKRSPRGNVALFATVTSTPLFLCSLHLHPYHASHSTERPLSLSYHRSFISYRKSKNECNEDTGTRKGLKKVTYLTADSTFYSLHSLSITCSKITRRGLSAPFMIFIWCIPMETIGKPFSCDGSTLLLN